MNTFKFDLEDQDLITVMYDPALVSILLPTVARQILTRRLGTTPPVLGVDYRDGDKYNLCRSNLICIGAHKDSYSGIAGIGWDEKRRRYIVKGQRFVTIKEAIECLLTKP